MLPNKNYWKNKKVLITGHTGFVGSWLSLVLKFYNSKVYGISLKPHTKPSIFNILKINKIIKQNHYANINNYHKLNKIVEKIEPDVIFHLAAQPLVKLSIEKPIETFKTNIIGTINICEISRKLKNLKKLVLITTDKCYRNIDSNKIIFFNEDDPLGGTDPYSASKSCAEISTNSYRNIFFKTSKVKVTTARAGNIIGGGDWADDRLIPDIYRAIYNKKLLKIRYPKATRPWQHVLDVVNGYLILAESKYSGPWNFGPNIKKSFNVLNILKKIKEKNKNLKWEIINPIEKQESENLNLNINKAKKYLKWKPLWDIKRAVDETDQWYYRYYNNINIYKFTIKQINDFFKN